MKLLLTAGKGVSASYFVPLIAVKMKAKTRSRQSSDILCRGSFDFVGELK